MADISTQLKATISRNPELIADKPAVHKSLVRTDKEQADYRKWQDSNNAFKCTNWLREELHKSLTSPLKTHDGIDFFRTSRSQGFRMHPALSPFSDAAVEHLFDFLKNQLLRANFQLQASDTRIFERGYWQEKVHRHTLTTTDTEGGHFSQIVLELLFKDNRLCLFSMNAHISNTDLPRPTDDFASLFESILA